MTCLRLHALLTTAVLLVAPQAVGQTSDASKTPASAKAETGVEEPVDLSDPNAQPIEPLDPEDEIHYPERRCGFTFALMPAALIGASTGYPNDALKIGRDDFYTNTGFIGGGGGFGWVGITVSDWLVFGVGGNYGRMLSGDYDVESMGVAFHVDIFPLFSLGDAWQDVGVTVEAGLSLSETRLIESDALVIDAGTGSRVGLGLFYEGIRAWHLSMGPYVGIDTVFSQSAARPVAAIGWRTAFYGGPAEAYQNTASNQ